MDKKALISQTKVVQPTQKKARNMLHDRNRCRRMAGSWMPRLFPLLLSTLFCRCCCYCCCRLKQPKKLHHRPSSIGKRFVQYLTKKLTNFGANFRPLIGFVFAIVVFVTSVFGNYIVTIFLPMTIAGRRLHRRWREMMDRAITFWMVIPLFFLDFIYGVHVRASGHQIKHDEPAIIIMNHRTRLDWLYFWMVLWRINPWLMTRHRIALKQLLRYVPGAGFGMQASQYIFLKRELDTDTARMNRAVDYYADIGLPYQILMFPEGTDKTAQTTERSNAYAKREGLPPLRHLLQPRTAGFVRLVQKMRQRQYLACVYDVTIAYPDMEQHIVQNETDLVFRGRASRQVEYRIRRIAIDELPIDETGLNRWLIDCWREKDKLLDRYYSRPATNMCGQFDDSNKLLHELDEGTRQQSQPTYIWTEDDRRQRFVKVFGCMFWVSVVCIWLYHLRFLLFVQVGCFYLFLNYIFIYGVYGGVDELIFSRWERHRRKTMDV